MMGRAITLAAAEVTSCGPWHEEERYQLGSPFVLSVTDARRCCCCRLRAQFCHNFTRFRLWEGNNEAFKPWLLIE